MKWTSFELEKEGEYKPFVGYDRNYWLSEVAWEDSKPTWKGQKKCHAWRIGIDPQKNRNYTIIFLIIQVGHNKARVKFRLRFEWPAR